MKALSIPVKMDRGDEEHWKGHYKDADGVILMVKGSNNSTGWSVGGWTAEGTGRLVYQGPMVPGPQAYANGNPGVITNDPRTGTAADIKRAKAAGLLFEVAAGDVLELAGDLYRVVVTPRGYVELENLPSTEEVRRLREVARIAKRDVCADDPQGTLGMVDALTKLEAAS